MYSTPWHTHNNKQCCIVISWTFTQHWIREGDFLVILSVLEMGLSFYK